RILAVLTNYDDAIHRQLGTPACQRFFDTRINRNPEATRTIAGEIVCWELVHVERNQLDRGMVPVSLPPIAFKEPIDEMLRVRMNPDFCRDQSNLLAAGLPTCILRGMPGTTTRQHAGCNRGGGRTCNDRDEFTP